MTRPTQVGWLLLAVGSTIGVACHTLLDIDEVAFGDGSPDAGAAGGGATTTGSGTAGSGGEAASGGGGGGTAGSGGGTAGSGGTGTLGPWSAPAIVSELSEAGSDDDDPTFTEDLLEIYIDSDRNGAGDSDIFRSTRSSTSDPWGAPTEEVDLNSSAEDTNMAIAPAGLSMWFGSDRPGGAGSHDIYFTFRFSRSDSWAPPEAVDELNSSSLDHPCAVTEDTLTMVMHSNRNGSGDLFVTTRPDILSPWTTPVPIDELNSPNVEWQAWLAPDGLDLYFGYATGPINEDLFVASRPSPTALFASPSPITELNSADVDSDPWLSSDQRYMMLSRGSTGARNIYESSR